MIPERCRSILKAFEEKDIATPAAYPTQVLTFLIADVRGYTRFIDQHGSEAGARLADRFAHIAKEVMAAHRGNVTELRGDEALAVFESSRDAVQAAIALQQRFRVETAADPSLPLRAGIGIDVGEVIAVQGGYRGRALNVAARLCSIAGPGEVFTSATVVQLAERIEGLTYIERGRMRLKGFEEPIELITVLPDGEVPDNLPPVVALVHKPHNLPLQATPFIGREQELGQISALILRNDIRLLTLLGPGGTGKTRLALQVGNEIIDYFDYGVYFVSLGSLAEPRLVASTIASMLKVKEEPDRPVLRSLIDYLHDRSMLLVLDNFEHLLPAADQVGELLAGCPQLKVLVTSRFVLHLAGEHEYDVPPLAVPDPRHLPDLQALSHYDAVKFFIERAQAVRSTFVITQENAPAVAEICYRLDGLPLAIELAAARLRLFPPHALLSQLSHRLKLLTGGARDLPTRQQTLRGTIDWSYGLLSEQEQALFARLAVFAGGCTFAAAEAVCDPGGELNLLDTLQSLIEKSLVRQKEEDEPRLVMLETMREYASEKLEERHEGDDIRRRHAEFFAAFAAEGAACAAGPEQAIWYRRLEADLDNLRAAVTWAKQERQLNLGLSMLSVITSFCVDRGRIVEQQERMNELLAIEGEVDPIVRVQALEQTGLVALFRRDLTLGWKSLEEALAIAREVGDPTLIAAQLSALSTAAYYQGNLDDAQSLQQDALALARQTGNRRGEALAVFMLAAIASLGDDLEKAQSLGEESLRLFREVGDVSFSALALLNLGQASIRQGELARAAVHLLQAFDDAQDIESIRCQIAGVEFTAAAAGAHGDAAEAAVLLGAAEVARAPTGEPISPDDERLISYTVDVAKKALGEAEWEALQAQGRELTLPQAVTRARTYCSSLVAGGGEQAR